MAFNIEEALNGVIVVCTFQRRRRRIPVGCGTSDDIHVFAEGEGLYVLCINARLDYVGIEEHVFTRGVPDHYPTQTGDLFLRGHEHYEGVLGPRGLDLSPINIAKAMADVID